MKHQQIQLIDGNKVEHYTDSPQLLEAIIADAFLWKTTLPKLGSDHAQSIQYTN
jgi:hypothetical protein